MMKLIPFKWFLQYKCRDWMDAVSFKVKKSRSESLLLILLKPIYTPAI